MLKEYFSSVLSAFFAAGLLGILVPEKNTSARYVKYLISLCVAVTLLLPLRPALDMLISLAGDGEEIESVIDSSLAEYTQNTNDLIYEQSREIICDAIKNELREKMSIPPNECEITLESELFSGEIRITKVNVFLSGYSMWKNPQEVKSIVCALTGTECEVLAG